MYKLKDENVSNVPLILLLSRSFMTGACFYIIGTELKRFQLFMVVQGLELRV
jgi:hypothetical protein